MRLILTRDVFTSTATLGRLDLVLPGETETKPFGFTCEDTDRGLDQVMSPAEVAAIKISRLTAIPAGRYVVARTWSQRFQRDMALVCNVPGFRGIRIHAGNTAADTEGCLLVGLHREGETVTRSRAACDWLDEQLVRAAELGEPVTLTITRDPAAWAAFREAQ